MGEEIMLQKYLGLGIAVVLAIATIGLLLNAALDARYEAGVADCAEAAAEAASIAKTAALDAQTKVHQKEIETLNQLAASRLEAVTNLERLNSELALERREAQEKLALTIGSIPDEEWFYLHEPIGTDVADSMRGPD